MQNWVCLGGNSSPMKWLSFEMGGRDCQRLQLSCHQKGEPEAHQEGTRELRQCT